MKKFIALIITIFLCVPLIGCKEDKKNSLYDIDIIYNDNVVEVDYKLNYVNDRQKTISELYFSLYPNAFNKNSPYFPILTEDYLDVYPNGESYGKLDIASIMSQDKPLEYSFENEKNILKVELSEPLRAGGETEIEMRFSVVIPNLLYRFGYGESTVNLTSFYPILCEEYTGEIYKSVYAPVGDPFYSNANDYKVSLTVPSTYVVASSLSPTKTEVMGSTTKYSYARENVRDIAFVLSKKFNVLTSEVKSTKIYYYYFNDVEPQKSLDLIASSFRFFSDKFTKYPYSEYVVCEADFICGGMEYPCLSLINGDLAGEARDYVLAHETAHQWWYGLVGVNECEEAFIDEGLTEISTALFMSEYCGEGVEGYIDVARESYREIRRQTVVYCEEKSAKMLRSLSSFCNNLEYVAIAYYRAEIMFYELYKLMGEKKFYSFLKGLASNYKYKNITYLELSEFAEKKYRGASKLLNGYVYGEISV